MKKDLKRSLISIAGAVLMRKVFKNLKLKVDYAEYGGAPLLGVKAPVIISHGKSNPKAIKNAILYFIKTNSNFTCIYFKCELYIICMTYIHMHAVSWHIYTKI